MGVAAADRDAVQAELARYEDALDITVVRALASATVDGMGALAEAAAP